MQRILYGNYIIFLGQTLSAHVVLACFDSFTFYGALGLLWEGLEVSREVPATLIIHTSSLFLFET